MLHGQERTERQRRARADDLAAVRRVTRTAISLSGWDSKMPSALSAASAGHRSEYEPGRSGRGRPSSSCSVACQLACPHAVVTVIRLVTELSRSRVAGLEHAPVTAVCALTRVTR